MATFGSSPLETEDVDSTATDVDSLEDGSPFEDEFDELRENVYDSDEEMDDNEGPTRHLFPTYEYRDHKASEVTNASSNEFYTTTHTSQFHHKRSRPIPEDTSSLPSETSTVSPVTSISDFTTSFGLSIDYYTEKNNRGGGPPASSTSSYSSILIHPEKTRKKLRRQCNSRIGGGNELDLASELRKHIESLLVARARAVAFGADANLVAQRDYDIATLAAKLACLDQATTLSSGEDPLRTGGPFHSCEMDPPISGNENTPYRDCTSSSFNPNTTLSHVF
mmetsp:Transcript_23785/g.30947  ORF Transcript_23785/g.30947 Transcript_23785/m.30947 type:complete len:279 (+) Transcript_23785:68-904(+)